MAVAARVRLFVARHRRLRWIVVAGVALATAATVHDRMAALDDARRSWSELRTVFVARTDLQPDDAPDVSTRRLPTVAVPPSAVDELPAGARVRQRVAAGEVLVRADITAADGPAAGARPGTAVVTYPDGLPGARPGLRVRVVADGVVLAGDGRLVGVSAEAVHVAVPADAAPVVAAAIKDGRAAIVYLP